MKRYENTHCHHSLTDHAGVSQILNLLIHPSITATCRAGKFVPRLKVDDRIVYLTVKGQYPGYCKSGWCLVAILTAFRHFSSHEEAAYWYAQQGCSVPSNCFIPGNEPKTFELTNGNPPKEIKERASKYSDSDIIRLWDRTYRSRIKEWPVFVATKPEFLNLNNPPLLSVSNIVTIFGKIPGTQNGSVANNQKTGFHVISEIYK